jgi:hypothetical protein
MARSAAAQLATIPERVSVLEVQVANINEKIDDVKNDISSNHTTLLTTLTAMRDESTNQHNELAGKVKDLEKIKNKWQLYLMVALAFAAGAGWLHTTNFPAILKFLGL